MSHPLGTAHPFRTLSAPCNALTAPTADSTPCNEHNNPCPPSCSSANSRFARRLCGMHKFGPPVVFLCFVLRSRLVSPCACSAAGAPPRVSRVHLYFFRLRVAPRRCRRGVGRRARLRGKGLPIFCHPSCHDATTHHTMLEDLRSPQQVHPLASSESDGNPTQNLGRVEWLLQTTKPLHLLHSPRQPAGITSCFHPYSRSAQIGCRNTGDADDRRPSQRFRNWRRICRYAPKYPSSSFEYLLTFLPSRRHCDTVL